VVVPYGTSIYPVKQWSEIKSQTTAVMLGIMSAALIAIFVFLVVALATFAVASLFDQRRAQARLIKDRLATAQKAPEREPNQELALLRDEQLSKIPAIDTLLRRSARVSAIQEALTQAGMKIRAGNFLLLCASSGVICGIAASLWARNPAIAWAALVIGAFIPYSFVSYRRQKRFEKIEELFPEAIDTLARAVRAGHAFTTALEMISNEITEPLASEFRKLHEEQKFGMPVRDALMNLTERVPLVDIKFFVTAVMLQRETGGNLAEILDNLSYVIRERFKIQRQVRVHTAQGRLTMVLLMAMPPVVVIVLEIFSPDFVRPLFYDPIGHFLVVVSIALQTIGYFVIRKIIKIQV
jgi:tight adherence protein B